MNVTIVSTDAFQFRTLEDIFSEPVYMVLDVDGSVRSPNVDYGLSSSLSVIAAYCFSG
jgi:hypothetical protein